MSTFVQALVEDLVDIGTAVGALKIEESETIQYGALATNLPDCGPEKYYLTTAISYMNGFPHIGHAYEFLTSDVLVRYHRVLGYDTFFLTGSDEHGQKVANSAEAAGRSPIDHCDFYVDSFKSLNKKLAISCSSYQRTTDPMHEETAQKLWKMCFEKGDIYLDKYEGWYNEREEIFVPDSEAEAANFLDVGSGVPLKRVTEESYFFRMSKYCERLIAHIENFPSFVQPEQYRNNILARLRKDGLRDLSISRTSFTWGVPVPEGFDPRHVMYVWFDALTNYLSGVHGLDPTHELAKYWPADVHIVGKDIIWFHCVIWPCMLMSAEITLPKQVYSHGFVNAADGRKMSKSYNNTIDPNEILSRYPADSIRYYVCASTSYGLDLSFSEQTLVTMHNSELADILGNLVHRVLNLCVKYCDGIIPDTQHDPAFPLPFDLAALEADARAESTNCAIHLAIFKAMEAARATNRFLTEAEPWKMKGENEARRPAIVRTTLEAIYIVMHFLSPVLPMAGQAVFEKLHTPPVITRKLRADFYNLVPGTHITVGEILFLKIEPPVAVEAAVTAATSVPAAKGGKGKEASGVKPKKGAPAVAEVEDPLQPVLSKMDLRVGRIKRVWNHETASRLFCEEIDVGDEGGAPRPIASGLREFYTLEEMQDRLVVVVCNLKEAKVQGFVSYGMVLASKQTDSAGLSVTELIEPPIGSVVGERVTVDGMVGNPLVAARIKKLKVWEEVVPNLHTNEEGVACWNSQPFCTSAGQCRAKSIVNSPIA